MSVLVYTESENGKFKKASFELATYARAIAEQTGSDLTALTINNDDPSAIGEYGISKTLDVKNDKLNEFNAEVYANVVAQAAKKVDAKIVVVSQSASACFMAPMLAVELEAGYVSNVVDVPATSEGFTIKRTAFTNKAFNHTDISSDIKLVGLSTNAFGAEKQESDVDSEEFSPELADELFKVNLEEVDKNTDKVSIADAEVVVSGGRGLKSPDNWQLEEDLADTLGAATACSKPVSDMGWRSHEEHVGQTGKPVASNLYIAIGISGAIQHLAGINASKNKVVINSDPEAPFFKAADYGVVGDAFEVVPKLTEKLKEFQAKNN